jgi:hypothetical protein
MCNSLLVVHTAKLMLNYFRIRDLSMVITTKPEIMYEFATAIVKIVILCLICELERHKCWILMTFVSRFRNLKWW